MRRIDLLLVSEISQVLDGTDWLLVGGMMVHAHCLLAEVSYTRSTSDVDVLVESAPESLPQIKARLEGAGFVAQPNFEGQLCRCVGERPSERIEVGWVSHNSMPWFKFGSGGLQ